MGSSERSVSSVGRSSDHPAQCGAHPVKLDQDFLRLTPCSATDPWVVLDFVALNYPNHFWPHVIAFTNTISPRSWTQRQSGQSKVHPSWRSSRAKFRLIRFRIACTCLQKWHYIYLLNYIPTPTALH